LTLSINENKDAVCDTLLNNGIKLFVSIAKAKLIVNRYADGIYNAIISSDNEAVVFPPIPALVEPMLGMSLEAQLKFLTDLARFGGKSILLNYLRQPMVPVLPSSCKGIDPSSPVLKSIDPFSTLQGKEIYVDACAAVVQVRL
jgi:hypothetical protein